VICWFFQGRVCVGSGRREREQRSEASRSANESTKQTNTNGGREKQAGLDEMMSKERSLCR
jgi:hypothetical protein